MVRPEDGLAFEDLEIGLTAALERKVTEFDIIAFAGVSGDNNPIHLDESYAATTRFGRRIAHGMLSAAYVSAVIGTQLPGPGAVYMSQSLFFRAPVFIGDVVTVEVEVVDLIPEKSRAKLKTVCTVAATVVMEGEALLFVPRRPSS